MRLTLLPIAPPPEALPLASYATDAEGHLYVRAERGCHAGEWLRRASEAEVALWRDREYDLAFCWRVAYGGWKRLVDVLP